MLFDYREGRGREGPDDCLNGFGGYLQTDGYVVYDAYAQKPGVTLRNHQAKYILTKGIEAAYLANRYTSLL